MAPRIGMLTLHGADNYGAVLQAYALQHTLISLGAEAELIEFAHPAHSESDAAHPTHAVPAPIARLRRAHDDRSRLFDEFRARHLAIGFPIPPDELTGLRDRYDLLIVGSDQVWNLRVPDVDRSYFLPFAEPAMRFSYAASFGGEEVPERARTWCAAELSRFRGLSVRERSGRRTIRALTGRDAEVHLDPVLLLDRERWRELARGGTAVDGPFVLLFLLAHDAALARDAEAYATERGLPLRVVTASLMPQFGIGAWARTDPVAWLSLLDRADCVFTNSYHGAALTLLLGQRLRIGLMEGELASRNGRIEELLDGLGMGECLARPCAIDAGELDERLAPRRARSLDYLRWVLGHAAR